MALVYIISVFFGSGCFMEIFTFLCTRVDHRLVYPLPDPSHRLKYLWSTLFLFSSTNLPSLFRPCCFCVDRLLVASNSTSRGSRCLKKLSCSSPVQSLVPPQSASESCVHPPEKRFRELCFTSKNRFGVCSSDLLGAFTHVTRMKLYKWLQRTRRPTSSRRFWCSPASPPIRQSLMPS